MASIEAEIDRVARLVQALEDLVYNEAKDGKVVYRTESDDLLVSYWSMVFDYCRGIVCLLHQKFHASAFALQRPLVEALVRAHIVLVGSENDVAMIRKDWYNVSYEKDGARIDKALGLGSLFEDFLKTSRNVLHSLTHSGKAQLQKRWDGGWLGSGFDDEDIGALLGVCSAASFLMTILMTRHFGLEEKRKAAENAFTELGKAGSNAA